MNISLMLNDALPSFCALLLACSLNAVQAKAQVVKDSAGIRVTEDSRAALSGPSGQHLSAEPIVVIGNRPGDEYESGRLAGALRLSDGRLVVADASAKQLRMYDALGNFVKYVGSQGEGPGEFSAVMMLARWGTDTIVAGDTRHKLSYFSSAGKYLGAISIIDPPLQMVKGDRYVVGTLTNGTRIVISRPRSPPRPVGDRWTDSVSIGLIDHANAIRGLVGPVPYQVSENVSYGTVEPILSPAPLFAFGSHSLYIAFGSDFVVREFSQTGQLKSVIRRQAPQVKVTNQVIEKFLAAQAAGSTKSASEAERENALVRKSPRSRFVPVISQMVVDKLGRLWVRAADASDGSDYWHTPRLQARWSIFSSEGRWVQDIITPANFVVTEIGVDYVLGIAFHDTGIETVVGYSIEGLPR